MFIFTFSFPLLHKGDILQALFWASLFFFFSFILVLTQCYIQRFSFFLFLFSTPLCSSYYKEIFLILLNCYGILYCVNKPVVYLTNFLQLLQRTVRRLLKKLETELPYDPAVPLLGIYLDKTIIQKDTCNPVFIAALFATAKTWKPAKCPSTDEWIKM